MKQRVTKRGGKMLQTDWEDRTWEQRFVELARDIGLEMKFVAEWLGVSRQTVYSKFYRGLSKKDRATISRLLKMIAQKIPTIQSSEDLRNIKSETGIRLSVISTHAGLSSDSLSNRIANGRIGEITLSKVYRATTTIRNKIKSFLRDSI